MAALGEWIVGRRTFKYVNCKGITNDIPASNTILKILGAANNSVVSNLCFIHSEAPMSKCIPSNLTKILRRGGARILNSIKKTLIE